MRRRLAVLCAAALTLPGLAACSEEGSALEGVEVEGELGSEPTVTVDGLDVESPESTVLITGDGPDLTEENAAEFQLVIAKGTDGSTIASSHTQPEPPVLKLGEQSDDVRKVLDGTPIGSRVVIALPVSDLYPDGLPQVGLTASDDLVLVYDLLKEVEPPLSGPKGKEVPAPADAPKIVEEGDKITGLDFDDAPKTPPAKLQVIPLVEGAGPALKEGDEFVGNYIGCVWDKGDECFDSSFERGAPDSFPLTKGGLIDGWVEGLVGVELGSRVMLVIPPDLGYGPQGDPPDIPGNSTLVFVIDVLQVN